MVYEDKSSNTVSSLLYINSSSDSMQYQDSDNCGFVQWVDPEWPPTLHNALLKLWEMYEDNRSVERMIDFSYLNVKVKGAEVTNSVVSYLKTQMEKKDTEIFKLQEKYKVLMNLAEAQGSVIRNLKLNHLKEKQQLGVKLQLQGDELNKSQEKLTQENSKLELHKGDLKKGHEKLTSCRAELKLHIADLLRAKERNNQKLKGIQHILA
ncbi:hypothetical protein D1007_43274 [Hordeum vulgare]|nr:hypothetical protein D1007_43274 [Hordeum vulgare]